MRFRSFLFLAFLLPAPAKPDDLTKSVMQPRLVIDLTPHGQRANFRPSRVMGAAIDGGEIGDMNKLFTAHNVAAMKTLGLPALTYRLRTELGIEAWHWNPNGLWSDAAHKQGYWISDDHPGTPIDMSWGYNLPRRGDTVDQANDTGYSRLTDGDYESFWKSNPYLDPMALHDGQAHLQWLVVGLKGSTPIDSARIVWGAPYATHYRVQYWFEGRSNAQSIGWRDFENGDINTGHGGDKTLLLSSTPISTKFVRVLLLSNSHTSTGHSTDWRDRAGFAVREVSLGLRQPDGSLIDAVIHSPSRNGQSFAHVSSTDPWHRERDRDANLEQVGIDRFFASHLGGDVPVMMPTGLLYDTPDNEAAEVRYIMRRRYLVRQMELGEEPDGQYGEAADYGGLYVAAVHRLRPIAPSVRFGGPSLQSPFTENWMSPSAPTHWMARFMGYLSARGRTSDLGFASYEYYPFDDICGDVHAKLVSQDHLLDDTANQFAKDKVPAKIPWIITEYGFSAYSGRAMSEMPGALLMANIVGQWLTLRGDAAYMFGYGPAAPVNQHLTCAGFGQMTPFMADAQGQATESTATFQTARLLSQDWLVPGVGLHRAVAVEVQVMPSGEVRGFAVRRPDGRLGILILNRSPKRGFQMPIYLKTATHSQHLLSAAVSVIQYSGDQYRWSDEGHASHPSLNLPPIRFRITAGKSAVTLPPNSITVLITQ